MPASDQRDAVGLQPLLAVHDINPDALAGIERREAAAAQGGDMDEDVLAAAIRGDEAVTLVGHEPLDRPVERAGRPRRPPFAWLRGGAVVDVQYVENERPLGAGADFAS